MDCSLPSERCGCLCICLLRFPIRDVGMYEPLLNGKGEGRKLVKFRLYL